MLTCLPALAAALFLLPSCQGEYTPKPRGYFRINLPEKSYRPFDTAYPYAFEYPAYARLVTDERSGSEPYWINIDFPQFKGRLHISYKKVDGDLSKYLD